MNDVLPWLALQTIINGLVFWQLWRMRKQGNALSEDMDQVVDWIERVEQLPALASHEDLEKVITQIKTAEQVGHAMALSSGGSQKILTVRPSAVSPSSQYPLPLGKHTLLVGLSGSGKSNTVSGYIIESLNACNELWIIDTKEEHGQAFGDYATIYSKDEASTAFDAAIAEGERRRELFKQASKSKGVVCRDHLEYAQLTGVKLPLITLVVEEMFDLGQSCDFTRLIQVLSTTRSAGINVLAVAQYINASVMPKTGSANFQVRVYMGMYERIAATLALGDIAKEEVDGIRSYVGQPGRAIVRAENGKISKVQIPLVQTTELNRYVRGEL